MEEPYGTLEYSSNNSGGDWWLTDENWFAMEEAGWNVEWMKDHEYWKEMTRDGRWLGALATKASIAVSSKADAEEKIREWERLTGQNADDKGCECCGQPHYFVLEKSDGEYDYLWD